MKTCKDCIYYGSDGRCELCGEYMSPHGNYCDELDEGDENETVESV